VPTHQERLVEAIRQMASFSVVDDVMPEILQRIAVLANDTVEPAAMVGLTMAVNGRPATPVFTDDDAPEIDSAQYAVGEGPCLDTFRDGITYGIPSTLQDARWPAFSKACHDHGVLSTLSVPVVAKDEKLGALNFYANVEHAFGPEEETLATAFAAQAGIVIANAQAYWSARALGEQLTQALESRVVIEQAKGLLMATGMTSDAAFDALRKASQRRNRKLRDVAAEIIAQAERRAGGATEGPDLNP
jgi:GAF domain-containing protein